MNSGALERLYAYMHGANYLTMYNMIMCFAPCVTCAVEFFCCTRYKPKPIVSLLVIELFAIDFYYTCSL